MNREILFRGKRTDNGEWVEGDRVEQNNPEYHNYIITEFSADVDNRHIDILTCDIYEVDPSTVGQYIGLKDRNGKRIFEGDIVLKRTYHGKKPFPVSYCDGMFHCGFGGGSSTPRHGYTLADNQIEVIGSIYDNPELMEETK